MPAACGVQRQMLAEEELPQGDESHPQVTAHPTAFTRLSPAFAYRLLWVQAVAILATVARQAARLLGRPGQEEW
jgi:hypothetical protein